MPKYNVFIAKASDNQVECRKVSQAQKFLPDWMLKVEHGHVIQRLDDEGEPLIGTIQHVLDDTIEEEEIAKKRGLSTAKDSDKVQPLRKYTMVKNAEGAWVLTDLRDIERAAKLAADQAKAAQDVQDALNKKNEKPAV